MISYQYWGCSLETGLNQPLDDFPAVMVKEGDVALVVQEGGPTVWYLSCNRAAHRHRDVSIQASMPELNMRHADIIHLKLPGLGHQNFFLNPT